MSTDEKPTVELEKPPGWAINLTERVVNGFTAVNVRLDGLEGTDKTLANEVARMSIAVEDLRAADRRHEDDLRRLSDRAKAPSSADMANESKIAAVIVEQEELKTAIKDTNALALAAAKTLQEQSDFMGMGKRGVQWLVSKEGRTVMAQLGAALVCAYEFLKHSGVLK